jgi:Peptidase M66
MGARTRHSSSKPRSTTSDMTRPPKLAPTLGILALASAIAGCNMITGADGLSLADEDDAAGGAGQGAGPGTGSGQGAGQSTGQGAGDPGPGGSGAGEVTSGSGGLGGSTGQGGDDEPPPPVGDSAAGVTITGIDLYQGVQVPLYGASSSLPVVAGKAAMVRVHYQTDGAYDGQPVTARFTAGTTSVEATATLGGGSSQSDLGSTLNVDVPGAMFSVGGTYRVDLVQPNGSGANAGARYPVGVTEQTSHGAQSTGSKLKILLVPVQYNGQLPDTSAGQVQKYVDYFSWQYPIPEVEVTVRSQPYNFSGSLGGYNGWSQLLDSVTQLRQTDNAPADTYYYGIHMASGSGLLGLGWVGGANDVWSRTAIGVGWSGDTSPETAVHELGHNHGRSHSPCGVSGDPNYPHSGASIGVWGFNPSTNQLLSPNQYVDFMSYCSPAWVSDYTYAALFNRLKFVNNASISAPAELMNRSWDRVRVIDGQAVWLEPVTMGLPPVGEATSVTVSGNGSVSTLQGHYYPYNHIEGGLLYVLAPTLPLAAPEILSFAAEGQLFQLPR